jgi:ABC-type glycerol-3-phosphate transport system permease component
MEVMRSRRRFKVRVLIFVLALIIILFIDLFPFYCVLISSLQPNLAILKGQTKLFPRRITFINYANLLFETAGVTAFRHYILNSLKVSLGVMLFSTIISIMGAYGLSRYEFYGKEFIARLLLFVYVFPTILIIIPAYGIMAKFHLVDTHLSLILIHTTIASPFCTWLLRSFFDSVPYELEEAAKIEGCNKFQAFFRITLPLAAPGILTAGIYALITSWGEYIFVLVMINSSTKKTVPLSLAAYMSHVDIQWGRLLAGSALNVIPILIIFLPLTKYFLKGFMEGALK